MVVQQYLIDLCSCSPHPLSPGLPQAGEGACPAQEARERRKDATGPGDSEATPGDVLGEGVCVCLFRLFGRDTPSSSCLFDVRLCSPVSTAVRVNLVLSWMWIQYSRRLSSHLVFAPPLGLFWRAAIQSRGPCTHSHKSHGAAETRKSSARCTFLLNFVFICTFDCADCARV